MKIYLSPSNQSGNTYSSGNTNEADQCNRIAEAAEKHLSRNGYEVKRAPKGQSMYVSINESNAWGADLHIPIHTNAGGGNGTVVFVYTKGKANMKYAQPIYDEVQALSPGTVDYGVRQNTALTELNQTDAIAVYVECEFHDDADLAKWIINNVDQIGESIAKGVCKADGKNYIPVSAPTAPKPKDNVFYRVQIGAFSTYENAEKYKQNAIANGYDAFVVEVNK